MFRRSLNRGLVRIQVTTAAPLLICAGDTGLSPTAAAMSCVRTHHGSYGHTVYIPGSSLKGVLRQSAEASLRSVAAGAACDPLGKTSCWERIRTRRKELSAPEIYANVCLICRTFGSLAVKGRLAARDLFPWDERSPERTDATEANRERANRVEIRNNVAINRITGGAHTGGLFDKEHIPVGVSFWGDIALENFQFYQLGLLLQALEDLNDGFIGLGSSTSRGFGEVRVQIERIVYEQPAGKAAHPQGVAALASDQEREQYRLHNEPSFSGSASATRRGIFDRFEATTASAVETWKVEAMSAIRLLPELA